MDTKLKIFRILTILLNIVLAVIAFRFGHNLTFQETSRSPSAIERDFDFSHLSGDDLNRALRVRLIEGLKLVNLELSMGFELGGFYSKNSQGQTQSVCEQYPEIELQFIASGISVSGDMPTLKVQGPCQTTDYQNKIVALMIPFQKILNKPVKDVQVQGENQDNVKIEIKNVSDSWPSIWVLTGLRISGGGKEILIQKDEIKNVVGKHLSLELPQ